MTLALLLAVDATAQTRTDPAYDQYVKDLKAILPTPGPTFQLGEGMTQIRVPQFTGDAVGVEVGVAWSNATGKVGQATEQWALDGGVDPLFTSSGFIFEFLEGGTCTDFDAEVDANVAIVVDGWANMTVKYGAPWKAGAGLAFLGPQVQRKYYDLDVNGVAWGLLEREKHTVLGVVTWFDHWVLFEDAELVKEGDVLVATPMAGPPVTTKGFLDMVGATYPTATYAIASYSIAGAQPVCPAGP